MKNWTAPKDYVEKKYNYTYKLIFKLDPRYYYYGVHSTNKNPEHDGYFGSGTNVKEYKKLYGKDCFDKLILNYYHTKKEALLAEDELVPIELLSDPFCLNKIQGGGTFDSSGMKLSEHQKKQISKRFKGKKRSQESVEKMVKTREERGLNYLSDEAKKKISEANKGRIFINKEGVCKAIKSHELEDYLSNGWEKGLTEERNKKISLSKIGEKNPMYGKIVSQETIEKMINTKLKKGTNKHSPETREKLSKLNKEKANDPEFRKKLSESAKGKNVWSKGRIGMHKGTEFKFIKLEDLEKYLSDGWVKGKPKKQ